VPNHALRKSFFYYTISIVYKPLNQGALSFISKTGENPLKPLGFPAAFDINYIQNSIAFLEFLYSKIRPGCEVL